MTNNRTTELLHVGDILWNEPCDERIVVVAANERNVWLRKVQKNDELAMHDGHVWSMLGKKCNVKNMCTQSYAQSAFELDGHVEQAIAATLGSDNAFTREEAESAFVRGYSLGSLPVGSDPKWDENRQTVDEHMAELGWVRAATLGNGTLTAEQVREAAHGHYKLRMVRDVDGLDAPQVMFDWQAIADELNARAERTCENLSEMNVDGVAGYHFICSECGLSVCASMGIGEIEPSGPRAFGWKANGRYEFERCPRCGAKVAELGKAVTR